MYECCRIGIAFDSIHAVLFCLSKVTMAAHASHAKLERIRTLTEAKHAKSALSIPHPRLMVQASAFAGLDGNRFLLLLVQPMTMHKQRFK